MILIADAGNTKSAWVCLRHNQPDRLIRAAGISPYFDDASLITRKVMEAVEALGCGTPDVVYFFGSGCYHPEMQNIVKTVLKSLFPDSAIYVVDDLTGAGIALFGRDTGVACILGTGSNAGIIQKEIVTRRSISLGYLLGDEGSGAHLGFGFLKCLLSEKIPEHLAREFYADHPFDAANLLRHLYSEKRPQTFAASLVPFMARHQHEPAIYSILHQSFGKMIEEMVIPLLKDDPNMPVGFVGGIATTLEPVLTEVLAEYGISAQRIVQEPIVELADYFRNVPAV